MANPYSVLIDLDRLKDLNTGLGQVALFFGQEISRQEYDDFRFTFLVPENFSGYFGNKVDYETVSLKRKYLPSVCRRYDLWYTIHQDSGYFPSGNNTPYIITINDLNFLGEKSASKAASRLKRLQKKVNRASAITVISKYTETAVRENLSVGDIPIHVIYCGVDVKMFGEVKKPAFAPEGDLLFCIGVVQKKKNYDVLPPFVNELPENYKLVITGNKTGPYSGELQRKIDDAGLHDRILMPGLISDEDKYWMYRHCKAVLFPSRFEGMGFPPVEAMRFGKPVFASTYSSIPEVSEDKAYYWEDFDPAVMAAFFLRKLDEFSGDNSRPELLKSYSMKYTWENNVLSYLQLFRSILGK